MRIRAIAVAAVFAACLVSVSFAEARSEPQSTSVLAGAATEKSIAKNDGPPPVIRRAADGPAPAAGNSEVFESIFIDAGKTVSLDSKLDYSSAATVAVGIECIICDSMASSLGASGLVLLARWTVPNSELFVTPEKKTATLFPYWDSGGVIFNVYGSRFRLSLQNKGAQPIAIEQITILRRNS